MSYVLRLIGCFWVFWTFWKVVVIFRLLFNQGPNMTWNPTDAFNLALLVGGVGLVLLQSWGRWLVLLACAGMIWLKVGNSLLALNFSEAVIRILLFYGIFIVLMALPQSRAATR